MIERSNSAKMPNIWDIALQAAGRGGRVEALLMQEQIDFEGVELATVQLLRSWSSSRPEAALTCDDNFD
jgi:hypothetical protein